MSSHLISQIRSFQCGQPNLIECYGMMCEGGRFVQRFSLLFFHFAPFRFVLLKQTKTMRTTIAYSLSNDNRVKRRNKMAFIRNDVPRSIFMTCVWDSHDSSHELTESQWLTGERVNNATKLLRYFDEVIGLLQVLSHSMGLCPAPAVAIAVCKPVQKFRLVNLHWIMVHSKGSVSVCMSVRSPMCVCACVYVWVKTKWCSARPDSIFILFSVL